MRKIPAVDGVSESAFAAAISVREGVDVGDSSGRGCRRQDDRGGTVMCLFGGVWLAASRALTASCLQRRWRQRQRGRRKRLVYSGNGGRESVGGVRGGSGNGNSSEGVGGVWGDSGNGNVRRVRSPVSGGADGGVRDCGGKGDSGRRKLAREVSGSEGGCEESFGLSAVQVSEIVILVCYGCNFEQTM